MIRTTILLALCVLIPLVACNSQEKQSKDSKITKDTKTNLETNKEVKTEPKKETSKNSVEVQVSGKEDCLKEAGGKHAENKILCDGAISNFPVDCFLNAGGGDVLKRSILCSGAESYAPLDCLLDTTLSVHGGTVIQGAILCSGVTPQNLARRIKCFYDADYDTFNEIVLSCAGKGKRWKKYLYIL